MFKILEKLTAKNKKQDDIRMPSHLSAAEQKQVQTVIDRARGDRTVPHSAQESIPFQRMFPDGICRVTDNYYKIIRAKDAIASQKSRIVRCPYCRHNSIIVFEDTRGHVQTKCKACGRETVFNVLEMRRLRRLQLYYSSLNG